MRNCTLIISFHIQTCYLEMLSQLLRVIQNTKIVLGPRHVFLRILNGVHLCVCFHTLLLAREKHTWWPILTLFDTGNMMNYKITKCISSVLYKSVGFGQTSPIRSNGQRGWLLGDMALGWRVSRVVWPRDLNVT